MDPSDGHPPIDERSLAALEALRSAPAGGSAGGGVVVRGLVDRLLERWPALGGSPLGERLARPPLALVAMAIVVVVLAVVAWLAVQAGRGGSEAAPSLPFTTTTAASSPTGGAAGPSGSPGPPTTAAALVVHAAGAVLDPGVHRVPAGSRVADVLAAAGGPAPDADLDRVNLAAPVADGQRLYVPRRGEGGPPAVIGPSGPDPGAAGTAAGAGGGAPTPAAPVDLNQATEAQLDQLPGVGPATAAAIVEHRSRNGPFRSVDGLLEVRGIGPAKLEALRDLVTVG